MVSPRKQSPQALGTRLGALFTMSLVVALNVLSAVVLKSIADHRNAGIVLVSLVVAGVIAINVARFVLWGIAHGKYPLSMTYPLTSLFFPLMLLVSVAYGDHVGLRQIAGTCLITIGVVLLTLRREQKPRTAEHG